MNNSPPEPPTPASPEIEEIDFGQGVIFRFCRIPAGTRGWVGSRTTDGLNDDIWGEEDPSRLVVLEHDLWLLQTPVTQAQYRAVLTGTGRSWNLSGFKGDDRPVEYLTWWDALHFCNTFSQKFAGLSAPYQFGESEDEEKLEQVTWDRRAVCLRLPTEIEWELACRAGACTEYFAGDGEQTLRRVGWFGGNSGGATHPVGLPPSAGESDRFGPSDASTHPLRLHDLHGNVWEWCWDAAAGYPGHSDLPRQGDLLDVGSVRALRGGSWNFQAARCRSAIRSRRNPGNRNWLRGFRPCLVRSPVGICRAQTGPASDQPAGPKDRPDDSPGQRPGVATQAGE